MHVEFGFPNNNTTLIIYVYYIRILLYIRDEVDIHIN